MAALHRLRSAVSSFLQWALGGMLMVMTLTILAQIVSRYLLAMPLVWSEELALILMVWITFVGSALILDSQEHVSIDMFTEMAPRRLQDAVAVAGAALIMAFSVALTIGAWKVVAVVKKSTLAGLGISVGWQYGGVLIGGALLVVVSLEQLVRAVRSMVAAREGDA